MEHLLAIWANPMQITVVLPHPLKKTKKHAFDSKVNPSNTTLKKYTVILSETIYT